MLNGFRVKNQPRFIRTSANTGVLVRTSVRRTPIGLFRFDRNAAFSRVHGDSETVTPVRQVVANERLDVGVLDQVEPVVSAERVRIPGRFGPHSVRQYRIRHQTVGDYGGGGRDAVHPFRQHARQQLDVVHAPVQGVQLVGHFRVSGQLVEAAVHVQSQLPPVVVETLHRVLPGQAHQQLGHGFRPFVTVAVLDLRHWPAHHAPDGRAQAVRNHGAGRTDRLGLNVVSAGGGGGIRPRGGKTSPKRRKTSPLLDPSHWDEKGNRPKTRVDGFERPTHWGKSQVEVDV